MQNNLEKVIKDALAVSKQEKLNGDTPEEAYKKFVHKVSKGLSDIIARTLTEISEDSLLNEQEDFVINNVNWLQEYLVGQTVGLNLSWPTPGYLSPCATYHYASTGSTTSDPSINRATISLVGQFEF